MTRFEKWAVLSTSAATAVTGAVYLGIKYLLEPAEPWAVINHPLQPWLLKAHILVAPLLVFAVGMIAVRHVWQHFRRGLPSGRRSGILTATVFAPMVVTGYLIQSVTAEGWLAALAWAHIGVSLLFTVGIAAHWGAVVRPESRPRREPGQTTSPR